MSTLLKSIRSVAQSQVRGKFMLSLMAVLAWLAAVAIAILSESLVIPYGEFLMYGLIAIAAVLATFSMPKPNHTIKNNTQNEHDIPHISNH